MDTAEAAANSPGATPRFSFLMITYNQEKYIADALNSALAQDYPDLEIVISDDCSKDRTFEIATDIAKNYHGPHKIILNRNEPNLGIGGNFYKAYTLSSGEWLFMAAGDDISLPERCRVVAEAIPKYPDALVFGTNIKIIDGDSVPRGYIGIPSPLQPGAALVWHRSIFSLFPALTPDNKMEDFPLMTRPFFLNKQLVMLPKVALHYRIDGHSFTGINRNTALKVMQYKVALTDMTMTCVEQRLRDLDYAEQRWRVRYADNLRARFAWMQRGMRREKVSYEKAVQIMEAPYWQRILYVLQPSSLVFHRSVFSRLRTVLSSVPLLIALKRLWGQGEIRYMRTLVDEILPEKREAIVISTEFYLNDPNCDWYASAFPESFYQEDSGRLAGPEQ
ncbi:MAG: glycosyltransferase family 2 protein [Lentisphaeria bacterium]|jgi:glycosyltransferase involved in cell wall biosynthesis